MTEPNRNYYPYFDWLRGVLAMVVVLSHGHAFTWTRAGNFAVQVFFALSGWLIGGILLHTTRADLPRFYFNRAIRIWVPYYVALVILIGLSLLRDVKTAKWAEFVVYKFTFVYNLFGAPQLAEHTASMPLRGTGNHFWSVNAEEQFYLLAPLLLVVIAPRIGRNVVVWAALAVAAWLTGVYASIVFGVLAAVVVDRFGVRPLPLWTRVVCLLTALVSAVGLAAGFDYDRLAPPCSIAIVLFLAVPGRRDHIGAFVGGVSYPMYLNHWIGAYFAHSAFKAAGFGSGNSPLLQVVAVALSLVVSIFLYWNVDRRLMARRERLFTQSRGWAAIAAGYGLVSAGVAFGLWLLFLR